MDQEFVAIALFLCVTYSFTYLVKALLQSKMRALLVRAGNDEQILRTLMTTEARHRRAEALRWGLGLVSVAIGFAFIHVTGLRDLTPGAIAILSASLGVGQLSYYWLSARIVP